MTIKQEVWPQINYKYPSRACSRIVIMQGFHLVKQESNMDVVKQQEQKHFVLVHGGGLGAWSWYRVRTLLERAGHRVTALDLAASGINTRNIEDLTSYDYNLPLLQFIASIPVGEKVILVGHSSAGLSIALAMENYPDSISIAVFLNAYLPDTTHAPSYVLDRKSEVFPRENYLDSIFRPYLGPKGPETANMFGPQFAPQSLYQQSPAEDVELGLLLFRWTSTFRNELSRSPNFTEEGYGSVKRAYITGTEDKVMPPDFQRWMIENYSVLTAKEIEGADHMTMTSKPQELCQLLIEIADEYANN